MSVTRFDSNSTPIRFPDFVNEEDRSSFVEKMIPVLQEPLIIDLASGRAEIMHSNAEEGDLIAQLTLAQCYENGMGADITIDLGKAEYWLTMAAQGGDPDVILELSEFYKRHHEYKKIMRADQSASSEHRHGPQPNVISTPLAQETSIELTEKVTSPSSVFSKSDLNRALLQMSQQGWHNLTSKHVDASIKEIKYFLQQGADNTYDALIDGCKNSQLTFVTCLLENGIDPNITDTRGTALESACNSYKSIDKNDQRYKTAVNIIEALLKHGAKPSKNTLIAICYNYTLLTENIIQDLLQKHNVDPSGEIIAAYGADRKSRLTAAVITGTTAGLPSSSYNAVIHDMLKQSPESIRETFISACRYDNSSLVAALLKSVNPDTIHDGLIENCNYSKASYIYRTIETLLSNGTDINRLSNNKTAFDTVCGRLNRTNTERSDILRMILTLVERGAKPTASLMKIFSDYKSGECVAILTELKRHDFDVNGEIIVNGKPVSLFLHCLATSTYWLTAENLVEDFIKLGVDVNMRRTYLEYGEVTPLFLTIKKGEGGYERVSKLLIKHGAAYDIKTSDGWTLLDRLKQQHKYTIKDLNEAIKDRKKLLAENSRLFKQHDTTPLKNTPQERKDNSDSCCVIL